MVKQTIKGHRQNGDKENRTTVIRMDVTFRRNDNLHKGHYVASFAILNQWWRVLALHVHTHLVGQQYQPDEAEEDVGDKQVDVNGVAQTTQISASEIEWNELVNLFGGWHSTCSYRICPIVAYLNRMNMKTAITSETRLRMKPIK